jgi:hypothetical protein
VPREGKAGYAKYFTATNEVIEEGRKSFASTVILY